MKLKYLITPWRHPNVKKWGWKGWLKFLFIMGFLGGLFGAMTIAVVLFYFSQQVPDFRTLADYKPALVTKIYAEDGTILAEYAKERRIYTPISEIPEPIIEAFLAAEDWNFYNHPGFDIKGIIRAALVNIFTGHKQGASTITQQVAKTFLLTNERTYTRKIKELILAYRMENAFTKDEILELYLNQIYFGNGTYGVTAASLGYFGKPLSQLTIGQRAILAGLPKAPSAYNPLRYPRVARLRRDVIIKRMEAEGIISSEQAEVAIAKDMEVSPIPLKSPEVAPHFSEYVRRYLQDKYGTDTLYTGGLTVHTTLDTKLQEYAEEAVYQGLRAYDRRHGYRGPIGKLGFSFNWQTRVNQEYREHQHIKQLGIPAAVLKVDDEEGKADIGLPGGGLGSIPFSAVTWAREHISNEERGPKVGTISDVLKKGDIIFVKPMRDVTTTTIAEDIYSLEQIPKVQGALVALNSRTGAIKAMVGGIGSGKGFNRAVQGKRQIGSSFKPFVYALALEKGYTPASTVLDAPVVLRQDEMDEAWKPHNYSEKIYGPSTLRRGLEKSRNLMTIRLARELGIGDIISFSQRFGLTEEMERDLSTALGSSSAPLLQLTSAYSVFPNQGQWVEPYFVDYIEDMVGNNIYSPFSCTECLEESFLTAPEKVTIESWQSVSPDIAYQVTNMLRGVVKNGTGWRAREVGREVGAKTGTTNDFIDAWFMGFSPELTVGVWVGFDTPQNMGNNETGSKAAGPIWTEFMKNALADKPMRPFAIPEGITFVRIDADTGLLPTKQTKKTIIESFIPGTEPQNTKQKYQYKQNEPNNKGINLQGIF
jgi:penicillin-binding protein 1A